VQHPKAMPEIDYPQMLALAYNGSKVLHPRAVEFACIYDVPLVIRSSFSDKPGTTLKKLLDKEKNMEDRKITAIAHKERLICYTLDKSDAGLFREFGFEIFKYRIKDALVSIFSKRNMKARSDISCSNTTTL
jgi:aspartate kinase